jgi:hypothetical protein
VSRIVHAFSLVAVSILSSTSFRALAPPPPPLVIGVGHYGHWRTAVVHMLSEVSQGAVDSSLTVRLDSKHRITVIYAFDNPCLYSVTARTRQRRDTLDVHFILKRRGETRVKNDTAPELYACPAAITNRGYEVAIDRPTHRINIVRGYKGSASEMTLIALRTVTSY